MTYQVWDLADGQLHSPMYTYKLVMHHNSPSNPRAWCCNLHSAL